MSLLLFVPMLTLTIDITGRCNLGCDFCYQEEREAELSLEQIMGFANGFRAVEIGGGEPFLHKDIVELVGMLTSGGKLVHIATNGAYVPEGLFDLGSDKRGRVVVQVSLPAANGSLYRKITNEDALPRVLDNIAVMRERYDIVLSSAIYAKNYEAAEEIMDMARNLSLPLRISLVMPVGKGKDVELLSPWQVDQLRGLLLVRRLEQNGMIDSPLIHPNDCRALHDANLTRMYINLAHIAQENHRAQLPIQPKEIEE